MEIREYDMMTDEARGIRTAAFVVEKDYRPEFDEWDEPGRATHLLAFGNGRAVATCRLYPDLDHADQPGRLPHHQRAFRQRYAWLAGQGIELNPEEAAITCESVRHAVSGDGRIWHNRHLAENLGFYRRSPMV